MVARFGTRVTVLQRNARILPREEPEIGDGLREILEDEGLSIRTEADVQEVERFRTTADGIYAIGDVTGRPMFTHSARDDADLLCRILIKDGADASTDGRVVPHAVFTDPEVASVGLVAEAGS